MLADGSYREMPVRPKRRSEDWRKLEGIPDEGQYPLENPDQIPRLRVDSADKASAHQGWPKAT